MQPHAQKHGPGQEERRSTEQVSPPDQRDSEEDEATLTKKKTKRPIDAERTHRWYVLMSTYSVYVTTHASRQRPRRAGARLPRLLRPRLS